MLSRRDIELIFCSLPRGFKMMKVAPNYMAKRPHIAEFDLSGEVVDQKGSQFVNGDKVIAYCPVRECRCLRYSVSLLTSLP